MCRTTQRALLLGILYLSFVSLGLPDTLLGVAWPEMRPDFTKSLEAGGILLALTTVVSVCASLCSGMVMARWHTGLILAVCAGLTTCAMLGYSLAAAWAHLILFTLLFGIGQGAVDTAVNAYMAKHYSSRHMQWVHACWGFGATLGPLIMSTVFARGGSWRSGYMCVALIQAALTATFFLSLPLWHKQKHVPAAQAPAPVHSSAAEAAPHMQRKIHYAMLAGVLFYFLYSGTEVVMGLWGASYLVDRLGAAPETAAKSITLFWASVTAGRVGAGLLAGRHSRLSDTSLIRAGCALASLGIACAWIAEGPALFRAGAVLLGLGLGPLYPSMMHDTPSRLGTRLADKAVGLQVGAALAGAMILPPLMGWLAGRFSLAVFCPALITCLAAVMLAHEVSFHLSRTRD